MHIDITGEHQENLFIECGDILKNISTPRYLQLIFLLMFCHRNLVLSC